MTHKQKSQDTLFLLQCIIQAYLKKCEQELQDSGFYDVEDIDAPATPMQEYLVGKVAAYEDILIEVLHMQGKRYYMEIIIDEIRKEIEGKENSTYIIPAPQKRLKS